MAQRLNARLQVRLMSSLPDHTELPMPALSPTMESGNIASWEKAVGDEIAAGDALAEIETDKATVTFESTDDGYLAAILVEAGAQDVPVGQLLAIMVEDKEDVAAFADYKAPEASSSPAEPAPEAPKEEAPAAPAKAAAPSKPAQPSASSGDRVFISPLAKRLAAEAGFAPADLAGRGTGPRGRVIAADVEEFLASGASAQAEAPSAAPAVQAAPQADARSGYVDIPHTSMRRVIAQRLTESKATVPHYYLSSEVRIDSLMALRARLNAALPDDERLSVNDFIIKASALALRKVPEMNSSWFDDVIRQYDYVDISVAVAVDAGLITPIVKDADKLGLSGISSTVRDLVTRAREKRLAPHEYQGGTFSLSNLGMYGVKHFSAIINPPQAAILAVGAAEKRVVPNDDPEAEVPYKEATVMTVTASCDHRVVDGAVGAQWLGAFRGLVEDPETMLL